METQESPSTATFWIEQMEPETMAEPSCFDRPDLAEAEEMAAIMLRDLRRELAELPAFTAQDPVRAASRIVLMWITTKNFKPLLTTVLARCAAPAAQIKYLSDAQREFVRLVMTLTDHIETTTPRTFHMRKQHLTTLLTTSPGAEFVQDLKHQLTTFVEQSDTQVLPHVDSSESA